MFKVNNKNTNAYCQNGTTFIASLLSLYFCYYYIILPFFSPLFLVWQFVPLQKIKTKKQKECVETGPLKEQIATMISKYFNPYVSNAPFLYPLKTSDNRKVF